MGKSIRTLTNEDVFNDILEEYVEYVEQRANYVRKYYHTHRYMPRFSRKDLIAMEMLRRYYVGTHEMPDYNAFSPGER